MATPTVNDSRRTNGKLQCLSWLSIRSHTVTSATFFVVVVRSESLSLATHKWKGVGLHFQKGEVSKNYCGHILRWSFLLV